MKTDRVTKIAVNIEQIIPALRVTANPLMGPDPIQANTNAAIRVVTFASRMVMKALLYPDSIAARTVFSKASSSRILSKIMTFASTVIPMVRINPAIPGRVRVEFNPASMANTIIRFRIRWGTTRLWRLIITI